MTALVKLSSLRADLEREAKGDWVESIKFPGVSYLVSALTKPSYLIKRDNAFKTLVRKHKGKTVPQADSSPVLGKLYVDEILHDWKGFDVPFTRDTALEILTDPAYREVVSDIEYCAGTLSEVEAEFIEDAAKNSEKGSAPSSKNAAKSEASSTI